MEEVIARLERLQELLDAATPGPWERAGREGSWWIAAPHPQLGSVPVVVPHPTHELEDIELIVALHNAAPELIAEAERLRAAIAELERERDALRLELRGWAGHIPSESPTG